MKHLYSLFFMFFMIIFASCGIFLFVLPQKAYSPEENRYLTLLPDASVPSVLSGDFQDDMEKAAEDQFPLRNFWMRNATGLKKMAGLRVIDTCIKGKDHYYFTLDLASGVNTGRYLKNLRIVNDFKKANVGHYQNFRFMMVPTKSTVMKKKLPDGLALYDADKLEGMYESMFPDDEVKALDVLKSAASKDQVYYYTDHHWNALGAYAAYEVYLRTLGKSAIGYDSFDPELVSDDFYGSLDSKILDRSAVPDSLWIVRPFGNDENALKVTCDGKTSKLYDMDALKEKDKYKVFLGGNFGEVDITRTGADAFDAGGGSGQDAEDDSDAGGGSGQDAEDDGDAAASLPAAGTDAGGRSILIIKDSFANSIVPYLTRDYDKITMVDLRYYNKSVSALLKDNDFTDVLVLYEMTNFANDNNVVKLKG
ncbi:MAG: DHHW family protein [Lachnospiraceae bacterium]|jgi:hypothetical protein|nr:DHHW family protein [Lachnospiraceae bacterium]MEE3460338.1 DHHW family protein [Lachnospiraceae bacterium]